MKANEYVSASKPSLLQRLFGQGDESYALNIALGLESMEELESELPAVKRELLEWAAKRKNREFVLITAFADDDICRELERRVKDLIREDPEVTQLYRGVGLRVQFNMDQAKDL
jgi:hypothetical protein